MDFAFVVRQRLEELQLDQRDLASASQVTESYISQILGRKKLPPVPNRTDIYDKMSSLLGLPREELARLATLQHRNELDRAWRGTAPARFGPMRELILGKCRRGEKLLRSIFDKDPFGELERLITRTLIDLIREEAVTRARDEKWLRNLAFTAGESYRTMRVQLIDLLDSDPAASMGDFTPFIELLIRSWDFDLDTFTLVVRLTTGASRRFMFGEDPRTKNGPDPAGLRAFLRDSKLSADVTAEELAILRSLHLPSAKPLFYYRILQNLRDPLNFK